MEYFKFLPEEITVDILSRATTESILECKSVCTNWRDIISHHPSFYKKHLHHQLNHPDSSDSGKLGFIALSQNENFYYFEYDKKNHDQSQTPIDRVTRFNFTLPFTNCWIVDSCNGLICLAGYRKEIVCICNPITKQYAVLPKIKTDSDMDCLFGFGFVSSTDEYKVVAVHQWTTEFVEVYIYTLGSGNGWRNLGKFDPDFSSRHCIQGFFADGALYWLNRELGLITTFNLAEEKFEEHLVPPSLPPGCDWDSTKIGVLDGFLFLTLYPHDPSDEEDKRWHTWLLKRKIDDHDMKKQPDEHQSMVWTKQFDIVLGELLSITKTNGVLTYMDNYLYIYDTKASTLKSLVDFKEPIDKVIPHRNTLVSLKELGEEDTKIMESIGIKEKETYDQPSVIIGG